MKDRVGNELKIGDRVIHFQRNSTHVKVQVGIIVEIDENRRPAGWGYITEIPSLRMTREWTDGWQDLGKITPWIEARNVVKMN